MADEKKFAGYICTGCGIGERLDAGQLETTAKRDGKMQTCKQHEMLCSKEGVQMIRDDIDNEGVTHVMIAACSRRAKVEAFNFTDVAMSRANLREGVIWLRPDSDENQETTQEMADDYIRMACAEVKFMTKPVPVRRAGAEQDPPGGRRRRHRHDRRHRGGQGRLPGAPGGRGGQARRRLGRPLQARALPGRRGGRAQRQERGPAQARRPGSGRHGRGDRGQRQDHRAPEQQDHQDLRRPGPLLARTSAPSPAAPSPRTSAPSSRPPTSSPTTPTSCPSSATARPRTWSPTSSWRSWPRRPTAARSSARPTARRSSPSPSSSAPVSAPPRKATCPTAPASAAPTSIKQAMYFKEQNADCDTTVLFDDLRTPGAAGEDFYRAGQQKPWSPSPRARSPRSSAGGDPQGQVQGPDPERRHRDGLRPGGAGDRHGAELGPDPYAQLAVDEAEDEEEKAKAQALLEGAPPSILNLDYRQGTDLPQLKYGFIDSHFICFPYETRRTGIYAAGPVRRPMDMKQAVDDAAGAAMKAIQAAENAGQGRAAHPRVGDLSYPSFRKEGCTQCKRCTVECPFGAINEDEQTLPACSTSRAAAAAAPAWAPARCASSPSRTTPSTPSVSRSRTWTSRTSSTRSRASWCWPARTTPIRRWTWPP